MERKSLALDQCEIKLSKDAATFEGYASVFGGVDSYGDTIQRGAFAYSLGKFGKPKMFFNHDANAVPIGKWVKAAEDDKGLYVVGEFTPGVGDQVHAALKHGTVDGISIGFALKAGDYESLAEGGRLIKRVSRLYESSIVTWPADSAARVDLASVKSEEVEAISSIREFEMVLRDAGLSKGLVAALTARAKVVFRGEPGEDMDAKAQREIETLVQRLESRLVLPV